MNPRQYIKRTIKTVFLVLVVPLYTLYMLLRMTGNPDAVFMSFSQALSLIPGKIGIYTRAAFYRLACTNTSDEISVGFMTIFSHEDTTIEKGVYIGPQCNIGRCHIDQDCLIGSGVHILSGKEQHNFTDTTTPIKNQGGRYRKIKLGYDCWIGNNSTVMIHIPEKCIVGSGSVVFISETKPGDILVGNPAKVIGNRLTS